jgi:hypothetical protein
VYKRQHTINKLVWVESSGRMYPFQITNLYISKYLRFGIPVNFETVPAKTSFPVSFVFGAGLGYQFFLDAEMKYITSKDKPVNAFYVNPNVGLKIELLKSNSQSFYVLPNIGCQLFANSGNKYCTKKYLFFNLSFTLKINKK